MTEAIHRATNRLPAGKRNGWVILDRSWAQALGVQRDRGIYRIRHRLLLEKLERMEAVYPPPGWEIDLDRHIELEIEAEAVLAAD